MVPLHHRPHRLLLDPTSSGPPTPAVPAASGSRTRWTYTDNEGNFDTSMVIILAALLCALIFSLGLNSLVRCALRCSGRFSTETRDETAARLAATRLKKTTLRQIPIVAYGSAVNIAATDCPICLGEFSDGQKVRLLPKCNHGFHVRCMDTWFLSHSSCPTCRHSLLEQPAAASDSAENVDVSVRHATGTASGGGGGGGGGGR